MEDVLTDLLPPSRFFEEDLDSFSRPSLLSPPPFILSSSSVLPLRPSLLILSMSYPSIQIFHRLKHKTVVGTMFVPKTHVSGSHTEKSLEDYSCLIYSLDNINSLLVISIQFPIKEESCYTVAKLLIGNAILAEQVIIMDSLQSPFPGGLVLQDEPCAFKLETSLEREAADNGGSLLKDLNYFPTGSVVQGLPAALLVQCQIRNIRGSLCISWPRTGHLVKLFITSLLQCCLLSEKNLCMEGVGDDENDGCHENSWMYT